MVVALVTDEELAEIEARLQDTSPAPWFYNSYNAIYSGPKGQPYEDWTDRVADRPDVDFERGGALYEMEYDLNPRVASVPAHHGDTATGRRCADAEFIAHAKEDVVALLVEIRRLRDEHSRCLITGRMVDTINAVYDRRREAETEHE